MLLRRLVPAILALGLLVGAASAASARSAAPLGHLVFAEQAPPCGCEQQLTVVAGDASGEKRLTTDTIDSAPAWSPNGKLIAFERTLGSGQVQLHVMSSNGGGDRILLLSISHQVQSPPTWSPDGSSILMTANIGKPFYGVATRGWGVLAVSLAPHPGLKHAKVKWLFRLPGGGDVTWSEIRLSPNGKWLALARTIFYHTGTVSYDLYLVHPNGKGLHSIAADAAYGISWSPDGSHLAFAAIPPEDCGDSLYFQLPPNLGTVNADGSDEHEVWAGTCESGSWVAPDTIAYPGTTTWSPDGTEILYSTGYQLHEANASTGAIQPFPVATGDCGSGPGSCKPSDPQWTTH